MASVKFFLILKESDRLILCVFSYFIYCYAY